MTEAFVQDGAGMLQLSPDQCLALCHALPRARDLDTAMRIVEEVRRSLLGEGLLTVNLDVSSYDPPDHAPAREAVALERIWTSDPEVYPVAGRKRKTLTPWTRQLLLRAEVFIGEGEEALAEVFDDHAKIAGLGLKAVVNVPLLDDEGRCFATFNALGPRPCWLPQEVMSLRLLAVLATPAVRRVAAARALQVHARG